MGKVKELSVLRSEIQRILKQDLGDKQMVEIYVLLSKYLVRKNEEKFDELDFHFDNILEKYNLLKMVEQRNFLPGKDYKDKLLNFAGILNDAEVKVFEEAVSDSRKIDQDGW